MRVGIKYRINRSAAANVAESMGCKLASEAARAERIRAQDEVITAVRLGRGAP